MCKRETATGLKGQKELRVFLASFEIRRRPSCCNSHLHSCFFIWLASFQLTPAQLVQWPLGAITHQQSCVVMQTKNLLCFLFEHTLRRNFFSVNKNIRDEPFCVDDCSCQFSNLEQWRKQFVYFFFFSFKMWKTLTKPEEVYCTKSWNDHDMTSEIKETG